MTLNGGRTVADQWEVVIESYVIGDLVATGIAPSTW